MSTPPPAPNLKKLNNDDQEKHNRSALSPCSKLSTSCNVSPYALDRDKAVKKILGAANRETHVEFNHHPGKLVMNLSAAGYTSMKQAILRYYDTNDFQVHETQTSDINGLITECALSIKSPKGQKQILRIAMYHTTSRILIQGAQYNTFVSEHLAEITKSLSNDDELWELNKDIKSICFKFLEDELKKKRISAMNELDTNGTCIGKNHTFSSASSENMAGEKGSMSFEHSNIIQQNYTFLTKELNSLELTDYLFQKFVFDEEIVDRVTANRDGRTAGMRLFLQFLLKSGKRAYPMFLEALYATGYIHVADKLGQTEVQPAPNHCGWITKLHDNIKDRILKEKDLNVLAGLIGESWHVLALHLGCSEIQIQHVRMDFQGNTHHQIFSLLNRWRVRFGTKASIVALLSAMAECDQTTIDWESVKRYIQDKI